MWHENDMKTKWTLKLNKEEKDSSKKYHPLIEQLSGVVSKEDLTKLYKVDEKARYILRKTNG